MVRVRRKKSEDGVYHIIQRGNERKDIFLDDDDKVRFLDTLARTKEKYQFYIYAYCLMNNHVHLIVDANGKDISQIMKSINVSYAIYFNRKYKRVGHLFQDRFKSELVEEDRYLIELSRYIHLNPVKARIVNNPGDFRWSSYNIYTGKIKDIKGLVDTSKILDMFSDNKSIAIKKYIEYVNRATEEENWQEESSFSIMDIPEEDYFDKKEKSVQKKKTALKLVDAIASQYGLNRDEILVKKSTYLEARNEAIKIIRQNTNMTLQEIGDLFGGLTHSTVSKILRKM